MRQPSKPTEADQVKAPPKQFITEDELDEIWNVRGLKYRIDDLHINLLSRGLSRAVDRPVFRNTIYKILQDFFVLGDSRVDPKKAPIPKFPKVF